ncbi:MAG TPA: glycosyltransferase [Roseiflexaceae bacterium]|nr:glycosyltransferase [Roseiflexaceae bacterium]
MNHIAPLVFWGIWLFVPALIDGVTAVASLAGALLIRLRARRRPPLCFYPLVSIVVPVYNSGRTLAACLRSFAAQDYPRRRMEVLLINNGSSDDSFAVYARLQQELGLTIQWHSIANKGKAWALNAGIHLAHGQYIFNIDSDTVLAPDAVRRVVEAFEAEPDLGAVTGAIRVLPPPPGATWKQRVLAGCEFMEYLTAFHIGREHQTLMGNLYTLSGAFSVFRRDVLLQTFLYSQATVTEDTDLTFELYERFRDRRIGSVSAAVAYVHPVESLGALYAQRVRWQRGQLEVSARHSALLRRGVLRLRGFAPARTLIIDHTLAFPRLVWTFLLPALTAFGYEPRLIVGAGIAIYAFYLAIDGLWLAGGWVHVDRAARGHLRAVLPPLVLLPLYRMLIFWFRLSGFLHAVAEPGAWRVQDPVTQVRVGLASLRYQARATLRRAAAHLRHGG